MRCFYYAMNYSRRLNLFQRRFPVLLRNAKWLSSSTDAITSTPMPEITEKFPQIKTHQDLHRFSIQQPELFWSILAKERLTWQKEFSVTSNHDMRSGLFRWFPDGRLNVAENCVDRHAEANPDKVALLWEKDEPNQHEQVTYRELKDLVCRISNVLKSSGVKKGDRVAIYLPVTPIAVASMLACARIGAIHTVVFAGFSAEALATRISDAKAETVITASSTVRGGKTIELKKVVDEAVSRCDFVKRVFVSSIGTDSANVTTKHIDFDQAISAASTDCAAEPQLSEDPLFLLYTSGSTGKPKGLAHSSAGYLLYSMLTHKHVFDYQEGDIFGCVADIGWVTGHTYVVYGPLANGATTLLFESTPTYPDPGRYWEMVSRLGLTHIYCAPTALRLLLRYGNEFVEKYDTSSLRVLGSVGEPLNHEAWHWFNDVVGKKRCSLVDTWWQTETGGVMISPRPSSPGAEILAGMPMRPFFGIDAALLDSDGKELEASSGESGRLCVRSVWPGIARTVYGDHQRYLDTYWNPFPGYFFSGDGAYRDGNGYIAITGRMDDVINVTGHRLGTAEVEDALARHGSTAESAVVGFPHDIKGESIYAFIVLKNEANETEEEIKKELKAIVRSQISSFAVPEVLLIVPALPKTRSGKIMRRILRKIASNQFEELGDVSTLADPSVVQQIVQLHKKQH